MVADTPNDEQLVTSASVVLNSERIVQCSIRPSSLKSLMYLKEQLDPHVRKLIDHPFNIELAPHILNCLAVLSSACAVHIEQPQNANSDAYDGILDESLLLSLIKSIKVEPGSYGHRWRGKLLLLWLESQPVHTIPHLEHVAVELSMLLQNWRWSDQLYWKNPHQELVLCRRSLYLDTLQLLLVNNHALWSQVLKSSCDYLQDLLLVQTPWQRSTHEIYELHNDGQSLRTKRTQIIWGHMLPPLVHVMAIWSKLRRWDPEVAEQYHTWKWSRAVRNSVKSLAKLRSISINHFCDNITPTEIMEMMESVADYTRSCNRRPRHPSKFLKSFRDLARLLLQDYDPTKLRFSNRQRAEQAQEFWENTSCRQFWKEHIRRVSEGLKIADMPVGEEPVDRNSHPLSEALG
ncbi:hypothetical protein FRC02_009376 [Tulasnella sp. 418]|nr:hypothetical protein FRC02_009376 [Tulasnella sp. 418]